MDKTGAESGRHAVAKVSASGLRLKLAIAAASDDTDPQAAAKGLKPIVTAVEMVFGSAAALSATFGSKVVPSASCHQQLAHQILDLGISRSADILPVLQNAPVCLSDQLHQCAGGGGD